MRVRQRGVAGLLADLAVVTGPAWPGRGSSGRVG